MTSGWAPHRVSAWVMKGGSPAAKCFDLGESDALRRTIREVLGDLQRTEMASGSRGTGGLAPARGGSAPVSPMDRLWRELWAPLRDEVGDAARIIVSPDQFLATLPFEILRDPDGRFLIEKHEFAYVESAAQLVERRGAPRKADPAGASALFVGALDYSLPADQPEGAAAAKAEPGESSGHRWTELPGTGAELTALVELYERRFPEGDRAVIREGEGSESRLKTELPRHAHLHLATHGYFEAGALPSRRGGAGERRKQFGMIFEEDLVVGDLPGLRSGLVCAGANRAIEPGLENGLLTAEEVSWLDLSRCDLVVLSACETGLGESRAGEGLMSLRRGFALAGARTVVSSLWDVEDDATRRLMLAFYERLWRGGGRLAALRGAQLEILRANREEIGDPRPETWGAFVLSGECE